MLRVVWSSYRWATCDENDDEEKKTVVYTYDIYVYVKLCIFHDLNIPTIVSPHMRTLVNTTRFIHIYILG